MRSETENIGEYCSLFVRMGRVVSSFSFLCSSFPINISSKSDSLLALAMNWYSRRKTGSGNVTLLEKSCFASKHDFCSLHWPL